MHATFMYPYPDRTTQSRAYLSERTWARAAADRGKIGGGQVSNHHSPWWPAHERHVWMRVHGVWIHCLTYHSTTCWEKITLAEHASGGFHYNERSNLLGDDMRDYSVPGTTTGNMFNSDTFAMMPCVRTHGWHMAEHLKVTSLYQTNSALLFVSCRAHLM